MKTPIKIIAILALVLASLGAYAQDKVVYHFDGGLAQATKGLRNIRNHLDTDPKAKILAVAHAASKQSHRVLRSAECRPGPEPARARCESAAR